VRGTESILDDHTTEKGLLEYSPPSNAQISARLSSPAGSNASGHGGCLEELRSHLGMTALINPDAGTAA